MVSLRHVGLRHHRFDRLADLRQSLGHEEPQTTDRPDHLQCHCHGLDHHGGQCLPRDADVFDFVPRGERGQWIWRGSVDSHLVGRSAREGDAAAAACPSSSCFGYATDACSGKEQHVQTIAVIEASLNIGVAVGYLLCTFIFELHARIWHILLVHVLLLIVALFISLVFLRTRSLSAPSSISTCAKILRPLRDSRDLFVALKANSLLLSFLLLLLSLFFSELFRMGSSSIFYLYLHLLSFDDAHYAAYFTLEQLATCLALLALALLRNRWQINDLYLGVLGLSLSLVGPLLFAFAQNRHALIFGGTTRTARRSEEGPTDVF